MPAYKLTYFDVRARAEVARLLFAAAGVEYEDKRVSNEDWAALKPNTPFGSLPTLEVEGQTICQSRTIDRFLAERFGLIGSNDLERARINMVMDCVGDMSEGAFKVQGIKNETDKAEATKKLIEETIPAQLGNFQRLLEANNGGDGFFVGNQLSVADLTFYHYTVSMEAFGVPLPWDKFPKLSALNQRVASEPKIKAWLDTRPDNKF